MRFLIGALMAVTAFHPAAADVGQTTTTRVSFEACLETIRQMAQTLGSAPTNIVETQDTRVVRLPAADGSVLVTCSRAKGTMSLTPSSRQCGVDIEC